MGGRNLAARGCEEIACGNVEGRVGLTGFGLAAEEILCFNEGRKS